jgi:hypothetical protein
MHITKVMRSGEVEEITRRKSRYNSVTTKKTSPSGTKNDKKCITHGSWIMDHGSSIIHHHPSPSALRPFGPEGHILRGQTRLQGRPLDAIHQLQGPRPQCRDTRGTGEAVEVSVASGRCGRRIKPNGILATGLIC